MYTETDMYTETLPQVRRSASSLDCSPRPTYQAVRTGQLAQAVDPGHTSSSLDI